MCRKACIRRTQPDKPGCVSSTTFTGTPMMVNVSTSAGCSTENSIFLFPKLPCLSTQHSVFKESWNESSRHQASISKAPGMIHSLRQYSVQASMGTKSAGSFIGPL